MGEPASRTDDITGFSTLDIISKFLRTLHALSRKINSDDVDDSKSISLFIPLHPIEVILLADIFLYLPTSYNYFLPTVTILESLLACDVLMELDTYSSQVYDVIPETRLYTELVWPATHPSFQSQGFDLKK